MALRMLAIACVTLLCVDPLTCNAQEVDARRPDVNGAASMQLHHHSFVSLCNGDICHC